MATVDLLYDAVRARADGSPYTVTRTDDGMEVSLDLADSAWWALMYRESLHRTYTYRVSVDEQRGTFTMLDIERQVEWQAGVRAEDRKPLLRGSASVQQGRILSRERQTVWAWDDEGRFDKVVDYSFSTGEGHELVRRAAAELGLTERMPVQAKIGLAFAVLAIGGILVGGVVALVLWLTGAI